jgi:hypothetical protein
MKHLKSFPLFEYRNQWELDQTLNDAFTSPEWQEKFRCIGRYPVKFFQTDEYFRVKAENDNVIVFNPWSSNTEVQKKLENKESPFLVAHRIVRKVKYRNDKFAENPSFLEPSASIFLTQQESMENIDATSYIKGNSKSSAEPRYNGSFNSVIEVRIKEYPSIEWVEKKMMDKYLLVVNIMARGEIYGNIRLVAQMLIDILTGKIDYEESFQRACQIIAQVLPDDAEILLDELGSIPPQYADPIMRFKGYSDEEFGSIKGIKDIGIF